MVRYLSQNVLRVLVAVVLFLPLAATAQNLFETLSEADRAALHAEIRAYLLANPTVIFEAVAEYERRLASEQADMDSALVEINAEDLFGPTQSYQGGNPEGDIVLVEFMDYRCGFCRRALPEMSAFVETDGQVRLVIKELPILSPASEVLARFALSVLLEAGPEAYWAAHQKLYAFSGDPTEQALAAFAEELGIPAEPVLARMESAEVTEILTLNRQLAQRLQLSGTPTFVIGDGESGRIVRGAVPLDELKAIAAEIRAAEPG